MEHNHDDELWQGGSWEQPSRSYTPPPAVHVPQRARPVLRRRRRPRRRWPWFAWLFIALFIICVAGAFLTGQLPNPFDQPEAPGDGEYETYDPPHSDEPPTIPRAAVGTGVTIALQPEGPQPLTYTEIYEKNLPSMVSIEALSSEGYSTGTGIIFTSDGYILTNAHVVAGAKSVRVLLHDNHVLDASLVGFHADEDLAVLKVEAENLIPAEFGDSDLLRCGDPVAALGDSLGYRSTITDGIISALDREMDMNGVSMVLIQTNAAINFGNSGGALINQYGQVVGITTIKIIAKDGSAEALGFAIPSRRFKHVADALIAGENIRTGVFGFTVYTFPSDQGGLEIIDVSKNSDAWAKGLRSGDVILSVNGNPVSSPRDLARQKQIMGVGDTVELTYLRDGQEHTITVALIDPDDADYVS